MSAIRKLISDTMIYGVSTIVARVLNYLLTPFFVKKFAASVYGVFTNLYAYAAMVNAILAFGMETTYFRYLQRVEAKDRGRVFDNSFMITLITAALFVFTMFAFTEPIAAWLGQGERVTDVKEYELFVQLFGVILTADALAVVPFAKLRADGRPIRYATIKLINILVLVSSTLFLLYWLPDLVKTSSFWAGFAEGWFREGWLGNVFVANLLASVVTLSFLVPVMAGFSWRMDKALLKSMLSYSFPILIANISFIINEHLDKMMFPRLYPGPEGERDLGIYGAVAKIAVFLNLFVTAFRLGVEPFFFSHAKNKNSGTTYALIMDYFIIAMVLVMMGVSANMEWLKEFIRGSEGQQEVYWSGLFIIPILLLNNVLLGIYINLSVWYKLSDQTRYGLYISGIGALITIVLNIVFIPQYSYLGAVLATSTAYLLMVVLSYTWGQKNYPIPYHTGKNISYLVVGAALSFFIFYVLDSHFIWSNLLLILFAAGVVVVETNTVVAAMRRKD